MNIISHLVKSAAYAALVACLIATASVRAGSTKCDVVTPWNGVNKQGAAYGLKAIEFSGKKGTRWRLDSQNHLARPVPYGKLQFWAKIDYYDDSREYWIGVNDQGGAQLPKGTRFIVEFVGGPLQALHRVALNIVSFEACYVQVAASDPVIDYVNLYIP